ncbi:hypothetical protein AXF42_Ash009402 [Apostasia shenzhenica]|uniref:Uncharacterized protein n=1 Tax=Apostasia shenzhenica TaxID=1088818 RepID=A0A2I0B403_9ASPA|nr:hypothetical protein AXF42_Ash009402 [Apostasia shenzhenica]
MSEFHQLLQQALHRGNQLQSNGVAPLHFSIQGLYVNTKLMTVHKSDRDGHEFSLS